MLVVLLENGEKLRPGINLALARFLYTEIMERDPVNLTVVVEKKRKALVVDVQGAREFWEFSRESWTGSSFKEYVPLKQEPLRPKPVHYKKNSNFHNYRKGNGLNQPRQSHKSYRERNGL